VTSLLERMKCEKIVNRESLQLGKAASIILKNPEAIRNSVSG